jgi:hypothetical protein
MVSKLSRPDEVQISDHGGLLEKGKYRHATSPTFVDVADWPPIQKIMTALDRYTQAKIDQRGRYNALSSDEREGVQDPA